MNDNEAEQAAVFLTKLTVQIAIVVLFGVFILTFRYPKFMLPVWVIGGIILIWVTQFS